MMWLSNLIYFLLCLTVGVHSLIYDPNEIQYNLNQNETATVALDYWGEWR